MKKRWELVVHIAGVVFSISIGLVWATQCFLDCYEVSIYHYAFLIRAEKDLWGQR